jgi:amidase
MKRSVKMSQGPLPYLDNLIWPGLITVANLPSTAIPTRRQIDGLPVGVQIASAYLEDRTTLRFAQLVEDELGGFIPPDDARFDR